VAVVQISKIQNRRGKENEGSGIPQLASGELGWAIDTQRLFIGNGAVSEGAPNVGNSELLTEHTDIFAIIDTYVYKGNSGIVQTGPTPNAPAQRVLQDRLDDRVSSRNFGLPADGTDQTVAFQRAVDQLFLNDATKGTAQSRVVLYVEPGEYLFSSEVYLPPYTHLEGAGKGSTVIRSTGSTSVFRTVNSTSTPGVPASDATTTTINQSKYLTLSGMTLASTNLSTALYLANCTDSIFEDIRFEGDWESADLAGTSFTPLDGVTGEFLPLVENSAVKMTSLSTPVTCARNRFINCEFNGFTYAAESKYDVFSNTFETCVFENLGYGIVFGYGGYGVITQATGPVFNIVTNSEFNNIERHGVWIVNGTKNISLHNRFTDVGNEGGTAANAEYSIIQFDAVNNVSDNDKFDRFQELSYGAGFPASPFVPDVGGYVSKTDSDFFRLEVGEINTAIELFRLPADSDKAYEIEYVYRSNTVNALRHGTLSINVNYSEGTSGLVDDYNFDGDVTYINSLVFTSAVVDKDSDSNLDTLVISYTNDVTNDNGELLFRVKTLSIV
tara:strand:- start:6073 stop:7740 length:1668 start_codon:yes stop_codon:yes gene_type:complete